MPPSTPPSTPRPTLLRRLAGGDRWIFVVVILGFLLLAATGATSSSMGVPRLTQDGGEASDQLGVPRPIRSDEYNANTPIDLSIMSTGSEPTLSPLGQDAGLVQRFGSGGPFSAVTFFDATLLRAAGVVPEQMLFAARWWMPVVLLLVALPVWFRALGLRSRAGWLAAVLVLASPSVAWWSLIPVRAFAYTAAGCALLAAGYHRLGRGQRALPVLQFVAGGVLIAGMPSFYVPWSIVLGLPMLVTTVVWILTRRSSRSSRWVPLLICGGVAALLGFGTLWEFRDSIAALTNTVYPGQRRSGPEAQPFEVLFGAPGLGVLQGGGDPVGTNASELSTSYTVAFVWLAVLAIAAPWKRWWRHVPVSIWVMAGFALVWLAWATVSITAGARVPLLNSIPAVRSAQVVGILAVICVCMVLGTAPRASRRAAVAAALVCGTVTGYAVSLLRGTLPDLRSLSIVGAALGVGLAVFLATRHADKVWAIAAVTVVAAIPVAGVNPLIFGLGDLRDSQTAQRLAAEGREARQRGELWVTDSGLLGPVMLANGVPALSGLQRSGPDESQWMRLDPERRFEEAWNRGGGYVGFSFAPGEPTEITTDGFDQTFVRTDPCALAEEFANLSTVVSGEELDAPCLDQQEPDMVWAGTSLHVYEVTGRGEGSTS